MTPGVEPLPTAMEWMAALLLIAAFAVVVVLIGALWDWLVDRRRVRFDAADVTWDSVRGEHVEWKPRDE